MNVPYSGLMSLAAAAKSGGGHLDAIPFNKIHRIQFAGMLCGRPLAVARRP